MARRLLLIGATGFAGRHLADAAADAGMDVIRAGRGGEELDVSCDLLDRSSLEAALRESRPNAVANLAGSASVAAAWRDPATAFELNATGTVHLLEAVAEASPDAHVLCVSSGEVYGDVPESELPVRETRSPDPLSPYAASKAAMELICTQHAKRHGLRIAVVRAFNHLGPGQSDAFAASSFARQIAEAERDRLAVATVKTGDLSAERDFTDVRDIARGYVAVCDRALTGTFNACSGHAVPIRALLEGLGAASAVEVEVEVDAERLRSSDVPVLCGSFDRLRAETGWEPEIKLDRTLADLLEWWRGRVASR